MNGSVPSRSLSTGLAQAEKAPERARVVEAVGSGGWSWAESVAIGRRTEGLFADAVEEVRGTDWDAGSLEHQRGAAARDCGHRQGLDIWAVARYGEREVWNGGGIVNQKQPAVGGGLFAALGTETRQGLGGGLTSARLTLGELLLQR